MYLLKFVKVTPPKAWAELVVPAAGIAGLEDSEYSYCDTPSLSQVTFGLNKVDVV